MAVEAEKNEIKIPKRILDALLLSLSAGVVPRSGAPYIAIGRNEEIEALLENLSTVESGGASVRFLIGRYGSGKSFLIQLIRGYALDRGFITADADLSPERRLCGGAGSGLATYRELIRNMATKSCPESGALPTVLSRHFTQLKNELVSRGIMPDSPSFNTELSRSIFAFVAELEGNVGGFDFSSVLSLYYQASLCDDEQKKSAAVRWLRGEYNTKTEAKNQLGISVSTIISDENWYDFIKLWAVFSAQIGYKGLIIFLDECVNLFKIPNRISRESNYEKILSIFNDTAQGRASSLGVVFSGTPQFLEDPRRGLFSYEALKSRLADSRYTEMGYRNLSSPVIRLRRLSDNELLALITRLTRLWAQKYPEAHTITPEQMQRFLSEALLRPGAQDLVTPREMIRNYLSLLGILRDNPDAQFDKLLAPAMKDIEGKDDSEAVPSDTPDNENSGDLFDFKL